MKRGEAAYGAGGAILGFDLGSVAESTKAHAGQFFHDAGTQFSQTFSDHANGGLAVQHFGTGLREVAQGVGTYLENPQGVFAVIALLGIGALTLAARSRRRVAATSQEAA